MAPYVPLASYRIQFSPSFNFQAAQEIVPYLVELGISDIYASPIFQARSGSDHGYDVVDPGQINQELGGVEAFEALEQHLQEHNIGWIQDIVPNHMAYNWHNLFLRDVLESGKDSDYYDFFDVNWQHSYLNIRDRILAPFLGEFYNVCLESGKIQLQYDQDGFTINYYEHRYPLRIDSYVTVFTHNLPKLKRKLKKKDPNYVRLLAILYSLKSIPSKVDLLERRDQIDFVKDMLWELYNNSEEITSFIDDTVETFNGEPGDPSSFDLLDDLLSEQFFNLSFWKVGADEINYRRFFTVNDLISLRIQDKEVFQKTHALILKMIDQQRFTGLRIDHIDGLHNPTEYLQRLRDKSDQVYIVAEKILEFEETLPTNWPIQGTTGYDFLIRTNSLFCQTSNEEAFTQIYGHFTGLWYSFEEIAHDKKRLIINRTLTGDVDNLAYLLKQIGSRHRYANDFTLYSLRRAIIEVLVFFPVYRVYVHNDEDLDEIGRKYVLEAIRQAKENQKNLLRELTYIENELTFIEKLLLLQYEDYLSKEEREQWVDFVRRTQQLTGPLMAKGIEDTSFYVYNRLLSLNEVGGDPGRFGITIEEFHQFNQTRAQQWPHSMNTLASHDTKRGEDTRARINVLSEMPQGWRDKLHTWHKINLQYKQKAPFGGSGEYPDGNDEYFLYQTLIGSFPFFSGDHPEFHQRYYIEFIERVTAYIRKAVREAKVHTDWLNNNIPYEEAAISFAEQILTPSDHNTFLPDFLEFQKQIQHYGIFNSLSQTLIKLTAPGLPDLYRGNEFWDLSMVDPDNRRPVDFAALRTSLKFMQDRDPLKLISELLSSRIDGRIKQYITHRALKIRKERLELFQQGQYLSLESKGTYPDHVVAFARQTEEDMAITIVPRLLTHLVGVNEEPLGPEVWQETQIMLPRGKRAWINVLTGEEIETNGKLAIGDALAHFPVALLVRA